MFLLIKKFINKKFINKKSNGYVFIDIKVY